MKRMIRMLCLTLTLLLVSSAALAGTPLTFLKNGDTAGKPLVDNDRIVAAINELLDIELEVLDYPEGDFQKLTVSIASGDIPDVLTARYPSETLLTWIDDGIIIPLNPYFDEIPTIRDRLVNDLSWTAIDGEYYGYVFIESGANAGLIFRKDWLDNLGLEEPTTTDEMLEVMRAFTLNDPDGNGVNDTYGYSDTKPTGFLPPLWMLYAFGVPHSDFAVDADGNVIPVFEHPGYKEAIAFYRQLVEEGLVEPEAFMNDRGAHEQKWAQGKYGVFSGALFRNYARHVNTVTSVNPDAVPTYAKDAIMGPTGTKGFAATPKSGLITVVTSEAKDPLKAAKFIELLLSDEGRTLLENGIEGVHYDIGADGKIIYHEEERAKENFAADGWAHPLAWGHVVWPLTKLYIPDTDPNKTECVETARIATENMMPMLIPYTVPEELEANQIGTIPVDYYMMMLNGEIDIDKGIEELGVKWRNAGGQRILEGAQREYDSLQD